MSVFIILSFLHLIIGFVLCMGGSMVLRSSPRLGGFLVGGLIAVEVVTRVVTISASNGFLVPLVAFILGGLLGALLAAPLYIVMAVISSSALGGVIGMLAGRIISQGGATRKVIESVFTLEAQVNDIQIILMIVFAIVFGLLTLKYDVFMTMTSTGFVGSFLAISGLVNIFGSTTPILNNSVFQFFAWAGLGLLGLVYQNNNQD
jgi:hypothetical protein